MGERQGDFTDSGELALFKTVQRLPKNFVAARRSIKSHVRHIRPQIIHAHSSFAGAFVRLSTRRRDSQKIIYTPHGFAFERRDISAFQRWIFRVTETALAFNTTAIAACSPRELQLSQKLAGSRRDVYVPNVAEELLPHSEVPSFDGIPTVAAVGRLTAARDPLFFAEAARLVRSQQHPINIVWIGGGDQAYLPVLQDAGVRVTGWMDRKRAIAELARSTLHVHPAAWDGFPMVLLEANALRRPSLVRPIEAFGDVNGAVVAETPEELADKIVRLCTDPSEHSLALKHWDNELRDNTRQTQRDRLHEAYGLV
ncbi:glycosyltransferase [Arthrobacter sunyaminii]|uniref:glycosyltransferase n=1 Tax=Arthrobacter sunyaminii TaxID=2816859 RepID=UPI001A9511DA|nr:glycosyltransferase [Arthrobacter sunyaminii]